MALTPEHANTLMLIGLYLAIWVFLWSIPRLLNATLWKWLDRMKKAPAGDHDGT